MTMGAVIDFEARRARRNANRMAGHGGRAVACQHCGEHHPIIRLAGGEQRCLTAFHDGRNWFCKHRGCREAWLDLQKSG